MNAENLQQRILKIISDTTWAAESNIELEYTLVADLGCDSLDCVEIMMALENEFDIEIDDDKFGETTTVQQVIDYVASIYNIKPSPAERTAIFDHKDIAAAQITECTTHHHACHCREHKIAVLSKSAQDVTIELDWLKKEFPMTDEKRDTIQQIVERCHAALNEMAADTATHENTNGGPGWAAL